MTSLHHHSPKIDRPKIAGQPACASPRYRRDAQLPKLLGLWPSELGDYSADGTLLIVTKLDAALRAERRRGRAGHWAYDINRHLALLDALKAERARLKACGHAVRTPSGRGR